MELDVSVVVPIHNEAGIVRKNTEVILNHLVERLPQHELILCENGSSDGTGRIANEIADDYERVSCHEISVASLPRALKAGFDIARSDKVVFFPVDLCTDIDFINQSVRLLDVFDGVIGSKRLSAGLDMRPPARWIASRAYHGMVRRLYDVGLTDTTCVKAFRKSRIQEIMDRVPTSSGIYQTELLIEASREGLDMVEVPVSVEEYRTSRFLLRKRIQQKLEDLLSTRLNRVSIYVGIPLITAGALILSALVILKVQGNPMTGFMMPYTFLLSMLLVLSGFQILTYGLLSNLIMQIRAQLPRQEEKP